jgi:hypothetical protein
MISLESKLYNYLTAISQLIVLNVLFLLVSIPLVSLPISILGINHCVVNMIEDRKLFTGLKFNKKIWIRLIFLLFIGLFSMATIWSLAMSGRVFPNYIIIALILSFNLISYVMIIFYNDGLYVLLRTSFIYSVVYFPKTILPIFLILFAVTKFVPFNQFVIVTLLPAVFFYMFIRINYNSIVDIKGLRKISE